MLRVALLAAALMLTAAPLANAETVEVGPSRDNTMYSESGMLSNGAGQYLFTGLTRDGFTRRALVAFDVGTAMPAGSTVTAVTLTLHLSRTKTQVLPVSLHRVNEDWGEGTSDAPAEEGAGAPATAGDATWTQRYFPATAWNTPGGSYAASPSATLTVGSQTASYTWSSSAMVAEVQGWLDGALPNHGWLVQAGATGTRETKRFDSRQHPDQLVHPRLTITFTPPAQVGACCAAAGSCSVVSHPGTDCTGAYQGLGSTCFPNSCPQPTGACCLPTATATCSQLTAAACSAASGTFQGAGAVCVADLCPVVLTPFVDPLPRPPVATPVSGTAGGAATYRLAIRELSQRLHRDLPLTRVWGFDDGVVASFPGPTIEASANLPVQIDWVNDLRDQTGALRTSHLLPVDHCVEGAETSAPRTVVHLHGGHVPAASDGYPEATFLPGQEVRYQYPNRQPAAPLWYHDHAMGITRLNVYLGLAGFYLLRDAAELALGLPSGQNEIAVVFQDRSFRSDGSLKYPAMWMEHFFGDATVVNGKVWPFLEVKRGKYRFRMLNGAGSRTFRLHLSNGAAFHVIGTDGGLLPAPVPVATVTLAPGERLDVVIDFAGYSPGTSLRLLNDAPASYPGDPGDAVVSDVMRFDVVSASGGHTAPLPGSLSPVPPLDEGGATATRDLQLSKRPDACGGVAWEINGLGWMDVTEYPVLGTVEVWRFLNTSGVMHPMHLHLVQFQVLDHQPFQLVGGEWIPSGPAVPPPPEEAGWKDTVQVGPLERVRVIARFEDYLGRFPYHCHLLEHEDHAMMRQFQTVPPPLSDAGADAGFDAGADADAGQDAGHDGGMDAGPDTGADSGGDVGGPGPEGCGCQAGGPGGLLLLLLLAVCCSRRRAFASRR